MRKTFAVNVHECLGHDLEKTRQALGQVDITSTIRYLTVNRDEIDQAVRSLELGSLPRVRHAGRTPEGLALIP